MHEVIRLVEVYLIEALLVQFDEGLSYSQEFQVRILRSVRVRDHAAAEKPGLPKKDPMKTLVHREMIVLAETIRQTNVKTLD